METRRSEAPEPFRLQTLGSVALTGPDPAAAARVVAQPKRLAVLAFLAARGPGQPVSRDRIVVTFWPEATTARARTGLRNALYFLRGALGAETLLARGDAVWIPPERLRCDAADLLSAGEGDGGAPPGAAWGDAAALLDLHRGEFLDGMHVSGAPEFERWVDRTRAALRSRATELAWNLSEDSAAAGEWITAAAYARRAADLAVDVEGATQRLIRLLDRAGDRAAALAAYRGLAARLREEFDAEPSPETLSLVQEVRARRLSQARTSQAGTTQAHTPAPRTRNATARPSFRSLAVLPFEDLSGGHGSSLAAGLVDDLLTALARLREVRVVSRTSMHRFATERPGSIAAVREVLGVDLVLEGSVRLDGDRMRVTVQLIDAERDQHLWAETYDRRLTDVFAVQTDVAMRISRALDVELSPREHRRLRNRPTRSVEAYQLYLKGREVWSHRKLADASRAIALFERALDIDPDFALAWVGLADAQLVKALTGPGPLAPAAAEARASVERALALDPTSGEASATLGLILAFVDWDHEAAEREHRRSVELSPGHATAHQWYGQMLAAHGRAEEGLAEVELALELDLLSPAVNEAKGLALFHAGRLDEAMGQFNRTLDLDPEYHRALLDLAACRGGRGEVREAEAVLRRALPGSGGGDGTLEEMLREVAAQTDPPAMTRVVQVMLLLLLERHDDALHALENAHGDRSLGFMLLYAPMLDPLAADPRFRQLMSGSGLLLPRWRRRV